MLKSSILFGVVTILMLPGLVVAQNAYDFPVTPADLAQVRLPADSSTVREVLYDGLEVRTRPIPEAAILTRLDKGSRVGLVSEGGGWSTMDMGGGFLGWIVTAGLGDAPASITTKPRISPVDAPVPPPRPIAAVEDPASEDEEVVVVKRF